jgi:hypothetical protein
MRDLPRCDCGTLLVFYIQVTGLAFFKIVKTGWLAKRPYYSFWNKNLDFFGLECPNCGKKYKAQYREFNGKEYVKRGILVENNDCKK